MDLTKSQSSVAEGEEQSWPRGLQSFFVVLAGSGSMRRVWICAWHPKVPAGQPGGLRGARAQGGRCPEWSKSHTDDQQITPSPYPPGTMRHPSGVSSFAGQSLFWKYKKRPFPLGYMFFLCFFFEGFFFFEHSDNQPQTHPRHLPAALSFACCCRPEGSRGERRGLWAKETEITMVTHLLIGIPAGLADFCQS